MTYAALPHINTWLLIYPMFMCYDWAYDTIPLISELTDTRNFVSASFYVVLVAFLSVELCRAIDKVSAL